MENLSRRSFVEKSFKTAAGLYLVNSMNLENNSKLKAPVITQELKPGPTENGYVPTFEERHANNDLFTHHLNTEKVVQLKQFNELFNHKYVNTTRKETSLSQGCEYTGDYWVGHCTYYSHAGCIGCHPRQIMANGEPFREWAMTIAFMRTRLNEFVEVANLDTGLAVIAQVTDRGGFEDEGILADLSLGVATAIGMRQQLDSTIQISRVSCP